MSNLKSVLSKQISGKPAPLRTGTVIARDPRGMVVQDDAGGATSIVSGSARIGQRISYRYGAMVSTVPPLSVEVVNV